MRLRRLANPDFLPALHRSLLFIVPRELWSRICTLPNQSGIAKAFQEFDSVGRMQLTSGKENQTS